MPQCRQFVIRGQVQGVFFRASARQQAQALAVTGWVRNRSDGSVEALACGLPAALEAFEQWLWQGPDEARIDQVETTEADCEPPARFDIS